MDCEVEPQTSDGDAYLIEVEEAANILGVSRTRLSQLTSKGVLTFDRRKIGTRHRLFYRRSELLEHLNSMRVGGATAGKYAQFSRLSFEDGTHVRAGIPPHTLTMSTAEPTQNPFPRGNASLSDPALRNPFSKRYSPGELGTLLPSASVLAAREQQKEALGQLEDHAMVILNKLEEESARLRELATKISRIQREQEELSSDVKAIRWLGAQGSQWTQGFGESRSGQERSGQEGVAGAREAQLAKPRRRGRTFVRVRLQ